MVTRVKPPTEHEIARRRAGYTQTELSQRLIVDRSYCSRVESGEIPASTQYQQRFAGACGVRVEDIFDQSTGRTRPAELGAAS